MEILLEILLEILMQILVFFSEFIFTIIAEGLSAPIGGLIKKHCKSQPAGPVLTAFAYAGFGALCGILSLWIAPANFIQLPSMRLLNLIAAPILAGLLLAQWRRFLAPGNAPDAFRLAFVNGALLASALAVTRYALAQ